jgi:hypothetical protein
MRLPPDVLSKITYAKCGFPARPGGKVLALGIYLDESGTHGEGFMTVAGYVAETDRWADFSVEWTKILHDNRIEYFHMKEFVSPHSKPYSHLSTHEKNKLFSSLIELIRGTAMLGVVSWIIPSQYKALTTPAYRSDHGSAYVACIHGIMALLFLKLPKRERSIMDVFIEGGHRNEAQALCAVRDWHDAVEPIEHPEEWIEGLLPPFENIVTGELDPFRQTGLKIGMTRSGDKKTTPSLQAADILAYCANAGLAVPHHKEKARHLRILNFINDKVPHGIFNNSPEIIAEMMNAWERGAQGRKERRTLVHNLSREMGRYGLKVTRLKHGLDVDTTNATEEGKEFVRARASRAGSLPLIGDDEEDVQS